MPSPDEIAEGFRRRNTVTGTIQSKTGQPHDFRSKKKKRRKKKGKAYEAVDAASREMRRRSRSKGGTPSGRAAAGLASKGLGVMAGMLEAGSKRKKRGRYRGDPMYEAAR